ncbi:putative mitochondrial protein [Cucumis melo var. makuwa]|uniref:Mitochondrial protein n=1 Tax=Cucumis melo var. makuwa TaxID=1194695 RepID=A0A5D3E4I0_CUCMM|nr:putative mitochondrial protein [Cucumis melo var. makuwa]TYK30977.1 putative mitochondrial protein [Cucumis melo var. makuwa]
MNDELQALEKMHTWDFIDLPSGKRLIGRYKQKYGIDYEETFALVAQMIFVRSLLVIVVAAAKQWPLLWMDVKSTFLNGTFSKEVYMKSSPGTSLPPRKAISDLRHYLGQHFEMKDLVSLNYFLGLEVSSAQTDPDVHLTPFDDVPLEDVSLYWLVGNLIYLIVTRLDIAYVIHIVSSFMAASRTIHFTTVLHILHYIKETLGHGLQFSSQSSLMLSNYSNAY